mmetsp:Transcript_31340/g.78599  ORF Transcript_31340/g.78599 Transcript_31340/m.78599 type:complete len:201 (-) Transcript_31340:2487-3089(-)
MPCSPRTHFLRPLPFRFLLPPLLPPPLLAPAPTLAASSASTCCLHATLCVGQSEAWWCLQQYLTTLHREQALMPAVTPHTAHRSESSTARSALFAPPACSPVALPVTNSLLESAALTGPARSASATRRRAASRLKSKPTAIPSPCVIQFFCPRKLLLRWRQNARLVGSSGFTPSDMAAPLAIGSACRLVSPSGSASRSES